MRQRLASLVIAVVFSFVMSCRSPAAQLLDPLGILDGHCLSADGLPIHYLCGGKGDLALVFVHGWLGDAKVWEPMMTRFAPRFRVVAIDLGGHGESGKERTDWSVDHFADDVVAVVKKLDLKRVVLIGHSMSGPITVKAANELGPRVVALVPVDTILNVEWDLPPAAWALFFKGLHANFQLAVERFFRDVLAAPTSPKEVIDRIVASAKQADPSIAVPMLERSRDYDLRSGLRALNIPICAINSDLSPTLLDINRRYAKRFDVELIHGLGHWPHLENPQAFGDALDKALARLSLAP
jgi:pimeloyl-ACP methyl ester carboxylesterase